MKKIIPFKKDIIFNNQLFEITSISLEHTLNKYENNLVSGQFVISGEYKLTSTSKNVESFSYELPFDIHLDSKYILEKAKIDIDDFYYEIINESILSVHIDVMIDKLEEKIEVVEDVESRQNEEINCNENNNELEKKQVEQIDKSDENETNDVRGNQRSDQIVENKDENFFKEKEIERVDILKEEKSIDNEKRCVELDEKEQVINSNPLSVVEEVEVLDENNQNENKIFNIDSSEEEYQSYKVYIVREGDDLDYILEKYKITKEEIEPYNSIQSINVGDKLIIPCNEEN